MSAHADLTYVSFNFYATVVVMARTRQCLAILLAES